AARPSMRSLGAISKRSRPPPSASAARCCVKACAGWACRSQGFSPIRGSPRPHAPRSWTLPPSSRWPAPTPQQDLAPFPQLLDEIAQAHLALALQPFGGDDRLNLGDARLDLMVDDDIVVLGPMAHFIGGLGHAPGDVGGAVLGAGGEPPFQFAGG